jgi:GT2 family glycosyltransferase
VNLLVIIVNYRTADLTVDALASLEPEMTGVAPAQVVVVDNDSGDGSFERISACIAAKNWESWASVLAAGRNGGFASGNNFGRARALGRWSAPKYVHLLNPDTVVRPGALTALVAFMDAHAAVGIAGSRLEDAAGVPQRSAFRFPSVLSELEAAARLGPLSRLLTRWVVAPPISETACESDWVSGASMIVRREVFDTVGALDERYFMYYEEVDFTWRARRAGWKCWYVPASRVVHLAGRSSGVTDPRQTRRRRPDYWFDSRRRYMLTHLGRRGAVLADLACAVGHVTLLARCAIERRQSDTPDRFLRDFARHSVLLKRDIR